MKHRDLGALRRALQIALSASLLLMAIAACASPSPTPLPVATTAATATTRPTDMLPAPTATPRPTDTPPPSPTATPPPVPLLTGDMLRNAAYPNEWPSSGVAQLQDGVYREQYQPDSATELVISLADIRTHGDLNGDGVEDVLAILISHPGGSGTFFYLAAVLNDGGTPHPIATVFLGDRVLIRSMAVDAGQVVLEMIAHGPDDPMCCPTMERRQVYTLQDGALALGEQVDAPSADPPLPRTAEVERIAFTPGTASAILEGSIAPIGDWRYILRGHAGQRLSLAVASLHDQVLLSCVGSDGAVLVSVLDETTSWMGELPRTLDYVITLVSIAGSETDFTLLVEVSGQPAPTPEPAPTPAPGAGKDKVIYLTFDDGPVGPQWTPQVLEALARYDAKATFFTLGQLAQRHPDLVRAEAEAGHSVANHTFDHHTLDGIGRQAFIREIEATQGALGEWGASCLRPPYGAMDAYTRTYAAELGYTLVMWNIDTRDWQRPGADVIAAAVVEQAYPGAIVLMHDGGGDRAQTVEALSIVLEALSHQGYVFEVVCR